jgi:hypothetical protein
MVSQPVQSNVTNHTDVRYLGGIHPVEEHPEQSPIHINLQISASYHTILTLRCSFFDGK